MTEIRKNSISHIHLKRSAPGAWIDMKIKVRAIQRRAVLATIVSGVSIAVLAGCGTSDDAAVEEKAKLVRAASVSSLTNAATESFAGSVVARYEAQLAFQVGGRMVRRHVNVGDQVSKGDVIAELDPIDYRLSAEAAGADLKSASASLIRAQADERRYAELVGPGAVSRSAYDAVVAEARAAKEAVLALKAQLSLAENALEYTQLVATQNGVITELYAEEGQVVAAAQPIASYAREGGIEVEIAIPENKIELASQPADVTLWVGNGERYDAYLREISPRANPQTRTYDARYAISADTPAQLGMTATVHLSAGNNDALFVPKEAIFGHGDTSSVWLVDDSQRLRRQAIEINGFEDGKVVVETGLQRGQKVVSLGVHLLKEGQLVKVEGEAPTGSTSLAASN